MIGIIGAFDRGPRERRRDWTSDFRIGWAALRCSGVSVRLPPSHACGRGRAI